MCGIIAAINFDQNKTKAVNTEIINMFQDQRKRGTEGFGIIMIQNNGDYKIKRATSEVKTTIDLYMEESPIMIMHHRQPTSTDNLMNQTHPIIVDNKLLKHKYLIIHNGIIRNDNEIIKMHEELGFKYSTKYEDAGIEKFNDSESLAIEVARYIEKQTKHIGILGSAAFIAVQIKKETNKVDKIYYGRNPNNPLKLGATRGKIRISSEGQGESVKENILYNFNLQDFKINKEELLFKLEEKRTSYVSDHDDEYIYNNYDNEYFPAQQNNRNKQKDTEPKHIIPKEKEEKEEEHEIEEIEEYELTIETETEILIDKITEVMTEYIEDLKDEGQVFVVDIKSYVAIIMEEMYKTKRKIEELTREKIIEEVGSFDV
jgi:glucosamine 6-phosphate synthetase-like amidotransferase/phosphosugar isomerase protein